MVTHTACTYLHPLQLWVADPPYSLWGGQVAPFLPSPMADSSPAPCAPRWLPTLCQHTQGLVRKSPWPQECRCGWSHVLHHAASPWPDMVPGGGSSIMGLLPFQGFSPSTTTFHASFVFLFRPTPPLFQKSLLMPCNYLCDGISPK